MTDQPHGQRPTDAVSVVRLLHGGLVVGLILAGAIFALLRRLQYSPPLDMRGTIGTVLAGAGFVLLAVAVLVLRPRMPERGAEQSAHAYWVASESRSAAIVLWGVVQAAGFVAAVGYFLTGATPPVTVGALALITLVLFRPSRLAGD